MECLRPLAEQSEDPTHLLRSGVYCLRSIPLGLDDRRRQSDRLDLSQRLDSYRLRCASSLHAQHTDRRARKPSYRLHCGYRRRLDVSCAART